TSAGHENKVAQHGRCSMLDGRQTAHHHERFAGGMRSLREDSDQPAYTICPVALRCAVIALLALLSLAHPSLVHAERLPTKIFTTSHGLANTVVHRIVRDSRGYLWFCTREGLSRFDGYGFTTYGIDDGLPSAVINDLIETKEGTYWIATSRGLVRFDPLGT